MGVIAVNESHFKKSPFVGRNRTAACACDALTNGYGNL